MASAEKLLHEAQFAFQSISFGESLSNTRNAAKAKLLCKKIIRKYPASTEASEAHAILRRLGEEAYTSKIAVQHRHVPASVHHRSPTPRQSPLRTPVREEQRTFIVHDETETLDWSGLVGWLFTIPKVVLGMIVFVGILLFGLFGPFLLLPLIAFILFTGPFRRMLKEEQRDSLNALVQRINVFVADRGR
jgi:hypothetical protein